MKAPPVLLASLLFASLAQAAQVPASPPTTATDASAAEGEPLPPNAPKQPYQLAGWCYGAMDQYLFIYSEILPQLRDIDRRFGSSVKNEAQPYADDMAAARVELQVLAGAVEAAEKASASVIAPQGIIAVGQGRAIWAPAETHSRRELAQAWLSWALPDRCDSNARELTAASNLLGQALKYNGPSATDAPPAPLTVPDEPPATPPPAPAPDTPTATAPHA